MKYKLVSSALHVDFERFINNALDCGWFLSGTTFIDNHGMLYQAMYKP